jgi:phosphoserine phosphatase RsbU/P
VHNSAGVRFEANRFWTHLVAIIFVLFGVPLRAQQTPAVFDLDRDRESVTSLDGLWRFHTGDDPQWINPAFDDSSWPLLRSDRSWVKQGYPNYGGFAWYRFTLHFPATPRPQSILLTSIYTGYQIFANGRLIGSKGSFEPTRIPVFAYHQQSFPIPIPKRTSATPQTVQIAIRVWEYPPVASWAGAGTVIGGSEAGDTELIAQHLHWMLSNSRLQAVNYYSYALLSFVIGLTVFGLFLFRRTDREYLSFAILLLMSAADAALNVAGFDWVPFLFYRFANETIAAVGAIAALFFFSVVLRTRRSFLWWVVCVAAALSPLSLSLYYMQWAPVGVSYSVQLLCLLPAYIWIVIELAARAFRRDMSARLLLAPATLLYGDAIFNILALITSQLGWQSRFLGTEHPLFQNPYPTRANNIIQVIFVLLLLIFLVRRFSIARREEERLSGELQAARSVQSLLIADRPHPIPGFAVHSVYIPASEVGGDFFQLIPRSDGSLLLVVGDVSGKGLKAAMTVSAIVGALRGHTLNTNSICKPAEVLDHLNQVLHSQITGFVTCCAILIQPDGRMIWANAGHIPPYLDGSELSAESGLPLGVIAEPAYADTTCRLSRGEQLTLVTDGVLEATDKTGQLFGFDRTQAISKQSAQSIADSARTFGQDDDITVLTLSLL